MMYKKVHFRRFRRSLAAFFFIITVKRAHEHVLDYFKGAASPDYNVKLHQEGALAHVQNGESRL